MGVVGIGVVVGVYYGEGVVKCALWGLGVERHIIRPALSSRSPPPPPPPPPLVLLSSPRVAHSNAPLYFELKNSAFTIYLTRSSVFLFFFFI